MMQPNDNFDPQQNDGKIITPDPKLNPQPQAPDSAEYQTDTPDGDEQATIPPDMFPSPPKKKHVPIAVIVVSIVVVLLLIGVAVFVFLYTNTANDSQQTSGEQTNEQETIITEGATPELVDDTIRTIDQNLNSLNDSQDFTPSDINDDALGL